jgi:5'-3' exonuclease
MTLLYSRGEMIWFFDRDGQKLRYEILRDRADHRYRVVITHPDGRESVEEVDEPTTLIERSVELMNSLRTEGWRVA